MKNNSVATEVVVSNDDVDQDTLDDLLTNIEAVTGSTIVRTTRVVLRCEDAGTMAALVALFDGPRRKKAAPAKGPIASSFAPLPQPPIAPWRVYPPGSGDPGEAITLAEKNRRLNAGEFATGTRLHHPKAGWMRVTGVHGSPQGMEPGE